MSLLLFDTRMFRVPRLLVLVLLIIFATAEASEAPGNPSRPVAVSSAFAAGCNTRKVFIAIGEEIARQRLAACPSMPIVVTRVSRAAFNRLQHEYPNAALTAVFLEQPPGVQLRLLQRAVPRAQRIGVLYSSWSEAQLPELRAAAEKLGLVIYEAAVTGDEHAAHVLHKLLPAIDAVLMLADPQIINPDTIKALLLGSARHGVPLIGGLSADYVQAGVAAGAFSTEESIGRSAEELMRKLAGGTTPKPVYAPAYRIHVNENVSRILDVKPILRIEDP